MSEATKVVGLVCAAGVGSRMGLGSPKQYMKFGSEAMLVHTVRALRAVERIGEIVVVVSPTDPYIDDVARHFPENVRVLRCGGRERAESVVNGLLNAGFDRDAWVLVHDAARPCLKPSEAARLIDEVLADGGVSGGILAVTLTDAVQYVIIVIGVTLCAYLAIDHLGGRHPRRTRRRHDQACGQEPHDPRDGAALGSVARGHPADVPRARPRRGAFGRPRGDHR